MLTWRKTKGIEDLFGKENGGWNLRDPGGCCRLQVARSLELMSLGFPRFILAGSVKLPPEKQPQVSTSTSYILDGNTFFCPVIVRKIMAYLSQRPIKRLLVANR
jgi:hypothetical protein